MRLSYKQDTFDAPRLAAWVEDLRRQGLSCEAEWSSEGRPASMERATVFALRLRGRVVFQQLRRASTFYLAHADGAEHGLVLSSARVHGVFVAPRFASAFVCLGLYALTQVLALFVLAEAFARVAVPAYALLGVGHYLWFSRCGRGQAGPRLPPLLMVAPAMMVTALPSLLNVPLFVRYDHLYWWTRAGVRTAV